MASSTADSVTGSAYLSLCFAAAVVGLVTSGGVWLFIQAFGLINRLTLGTFGAAPPPVGIMATVAIPALGGLLVALWMHYLSRPAKLAAMGHIIDGVAEQEGRLNQRNGVVFVVGSALGAAYGDVVAQALPGVHVSPTAFAMVATAAMLAGTFHAPLFGAMMIFEMTSDYGMLFPLMLAAAIGYVVARRFQPGSAYTFAFPGLGIHLEPGTFTVRIDEHD